MVKRCGVYLYIHLSVLPILPDNRGALLPDRVDRGLQMRADLQGHDTGIANAETFGTVDLQAGVDDSREIGSVPIGIAIVDAFYICPARALYPPAHSTRPHGMPIRNRVLPHPRLHLILTRRRGNPLHDNPLQRFRATDPVPEALRLAHEFEIDAAVIEIVFRIDDRVVRRCRFCTRG